MLQRIDIGDYTHHEVAAKLIAYSDTLSDILGTRVTNIIATNETFRNN